MISIEDDSFDCNSIWYFADGCSCELKVMLNTRTESFGFSALSSIIYNDSPNVSEEIARKCANILIMAGADFDVSDYRGTYSMFTQ